MEGRYLKINIYFVSLKGLCIGSGGVNMNATMNGYVSFMHEQENADSMHYTRYLNRILLPFVKYSRYQVNNLAKDEYNIPDALSAVG